MDSSFVASLLIFSNCFLFPIRCSKSFRVHSEFDDNKCNEIWIYFVMNGLHWSIAATANGSITFIFSFIKDKNATCGPQLWQLVYFAWFWFIFLAFFETFHHFLLSTEQKHTIFYTFLCPAVEINNFNVSSVCPKALMQTLPLLRLVFLDNSSQPWILPLLMDKSGTYEYGKKVWILWWHKSSTYLFILDVVKTWSIAFNMDATE